MEQAPNTDFDLIGPFILESRRERVRELLCKPERRRKLVERFSHAHDFDPRFIVTVTPSLSSHSGIASLLQKAGFREENCRAISEDSSLDGRALPLTQALMEVVGCGMGTFLSCIPGKLGYFENEDERFILKR